MDGASEALNDQNKGWESLTTDADTTGVARVLLTLAKKESRFLQQTAGKGSLNSRGINPRLINHMKKTYLQIGNAL